MITYVDISLKMIIIQQYLKDSSEAAQFNWFLQLQGKTYRHFANRRTLAVSIADQHCFIKIHQGVGWKEIIKNLITFRLPVLGAMDEWRAICYLQNLPILTPQLLAYGQRGNNPAQLESFVLTRALENTLSLEEICATWPEHTPSFALKLSLLKEVARISQVLHTHGVNHRDYYLCHFLLPRTYLESDFSQIPRLYLIDLHRVQIRRYVPLRWQVKDIGGLYFSALKIGLTQRDIYRFMQYYKEKTLRQTLLDDMSFWTAVTKRAEQLNHRS